MPVSSTAIPQDMRDLLIRLDQRCTDGFDTVNKKLDDQARRGDAHERRIADLEASDNNRKSYVPRFEAVERQVQTHESRFAQIDGANKMSAFLANVARVAMGAALAVAAVLGVQAYVQKPTAVPSVETSVSSANPQARRSGR